MNLNIDLKVTKDLSSCPTAVLPAAASPLFAHPPTLPHLHPPIEVTCLQTLELTGPVHSCPTPVVQPQVAGPRVSIDRRHPEMCPLFTDHLLTFHPPPPPTDLRLLQLAGLLVPPHLLKL